MSRQRLRLRIDPVIESAEAIAARVRLELPGHAGIAAAADGVTGAAHEAKRVAERLRRPWGLHRVPVAFLTVALLLLGAWIYWSFFHISTLVIAMPVRDASQLHAQLAQRGRVRFEEVLTDGSRANVALLSDDRADLGFVQGGIPIPPELPRWETPHPEHILFFLGPGVEDLQQVQRVLTSVEGQGSHSVARLFTEYWRIDAQVQYVHEWSRLTAKDGGTVPAEIDAVFVIKDMGNENTYRAVQRLADAGFRLVPPDIGGHIASMDFLKETEIPRSYLCWDPPVPDKATRTYTVSTYLVARQGLTPRQLAAARPLVRSADGEDVMGVVPTLGTAGEVLQGVEAFLGILIYIGLTFLALLGIEITTYRKRFHELNTLISLISMHQSAKDVLGLTDDDKRREHLRYLSICSDLLGLISVTSGYYAQENSSLIHSNLLEIIHHRCSGLKLNIQTKILHAGIRLPDDEPEHPTGLAAPPAAD